MGLLESGLEFGRRSSARAGSGGSSAATGGLSEEGTPSAGAFWSAEDYLGAAGQSSDLEDHWAEAPPANALPRRHVASAAIVSPERDVTATSFDHVAEVPPPEATRAPSIGLSPEFGFFEECADTASGAGGWIEHGEPDLSFFDPAATAAPVLADVFAGRHTWRISTRAGILALATSIPHRHGRELAGRVFEEALAEARWPGFFRSWLRLAPSLECPRVIALAIELKQHWDDSPHLWRFREAPGRPSRQHEGACDQLGWRRAVVMAETKTHEPCWRILDDDLLGAWEELDESCPGFWSFAEWLEVMCCGDEAEVHALSLVAARGRGRRALHLQDMCERLGLGRAGAACRSGRMPNVDQDVATFAFRDGHFRPGVGVTMIERRAPTVDEMRVREDQ
ncbi:hypothetical protein KZ813_00185 [Sphingomonas sp. RHCKR7]|uniref:hypothetical protein n=1 Tax=Sphingomonas folli TaxID=2862497 RepID=UPI001CA4C168|nr:hypothetical protein [Sphingomonas folli]MBW6525253.1 hypothetical protein [Sphingomonas folli]